MKKQRVITITMDIEMETHEALLSMNVIENGKQKTEFTLSEALTTVSALSWAESSMLKNLRERALELDQEVLNSNAKEEK